MSVNLFLIILLAVAYTEAQDNRICECNTDQDVKDNENLWDLLKKLEKMASEAPDDQKIDFAVPPGILNQFECNCDEKSRKKRRVAEVEIEHPEVIAEEKPDNMEVREKRHIIKPTKPYEFDLRCPKGTYWIAQAHTCVPKAGFDETESEEQDEQ